MGMQILTLMFSMLTLLQINDVHGYMDSHLDWMPGPSQPQYRKVGGYARLQTLVQKIRSEVKNKVILCDNGDTFHGTKPVVETKGKILIPILNSLGLDAMTAHWDFAYGPNHLKSLAVDLNFPILAINVYDKKSKKRFFEPYKIITSGPLKIGIIGIASNIVDKTMPPIFSEGLYFTDGREELPRFIDELESEKVDLKVVLSHLGLPQDIALVKETPGIDVVLSGHTHNRLFQPICQEGTLIIQSGCHGAFLGKLDLEIKNRKITHYQHELIEVSEVIEPDPIVGKMVEAALSPFEHHLKEKVGLVETALNRNTNLESTMDNFLLQAIQAETKTPLAFSNGWRWGAPVVPGPVTENDLFNIIPMETPISTVELSGREIIKMLEDNLENTFSSDPWHQKGGYTKRCLGLTAYIKIENPARTRIQKLYIGNEEVSLDKIYLSAYLTMQGVPPQFGRNRKDLPVTAHQAMTNYLKNGQSIAAELGGSFVVV